MASLYRSCWLFGVSLWLILVSLWSFCISSIYSLMADRMMQTVVCFSRPHVATVLSREHALTAWLIFDVCRSRTAADISMCGLKKVRTCTHQNDLTTRRHVAPHASFCPGTEASCPGGSVEFQPSCRILWHFGVK